MSPRIGRFALSLALFAALLACKKLQRESPEPTEDPAVAAPEPVTEVPEPPARKLFDFDLASVCNEMPEKRAAEYTKTPGKIHPTIIFQRGGENEKYTKSYSGDFDGWKAEQAESYELVACVTIKSRKKVKECKFDSKTPVRYLDLNDASYELRVLEAKTGKLVDQKNVELKAESRCPMFFMFREERESKDPVYEQALIQFAKGHVAPK
jgi:hypothetical protein